MVNRMKLLALGLNHHCLDNECSAKFKECIAKNGTTHKLVTATIATSPNGLSRCSKTISSPSSAEPKIDFPSPCGAILCTVNLLQQSNVAPKVSVYAHVHEQHDYMKCLFAPLGCAVMAHVKPENQ
jgi:hypothetical protein